MTRCARAQEWMAAAADGELSPRRRDVLDRHLAGCPGCRREMEATVRILAAAAALPGETDVPARLEQDTLRRVRLAAADEARAATRGWWHAVRLPAFALAGAALLALAVGILGGTGARQGGIAGTADERVARGPAATGAGPAMPPPRIAAARRPGAMPPPDPPPELTAAPDMFVDLPILRSLEKLDNFEAIQTTTLDDVQPAPDGAGERSNG